MDIVRVLVPIMALSIPLIVVTSIFLVQPLVKSLTKFAESQANRSTPANPRGLEEIEQRMERIERLVERVLEEQAFQRELHGATPAARRLATERARDTNS